MTIEKFDNKFDTMPCASLHEVWKYHERVRAIFSSDLAEFRESGARGTMKGVRSTELGSSQMPRWLDQFIESVAITPGLLDFAGLYIAMAHHVKHKVQRSCCKCPYIPSQSIREFCVASASVVDNSFVKVSGMICGAAQDMEPLVQAESALCLVQEREDSQVQIYSTTSQLVTFTVRVSDANIILRSFDRVNFRVHKLVLAMVSPIFTICYLSPSFRKAKLLMGFP